MKSQPNILPQLSDRFFITDGGIETTLIYKHGLELPSFASFVLFKEQPGRDALREYFSLYAQLALKYGVGVILESATWRANPEWASKLGYDSNALREANRQAIALLQFVRRTYQTETTPIVISGCLGPRGDGYQPDHLMSAEDAEDYHAPQIRTFQEAGVDLISALTMNYVEEAIGIVWAARSAGLPVAISFTVETDGKLPTGLSLENAIQDVDDATDNAVVYYMINCAHPDHFENAVDPSEPWAKRIRGIRVNASKQSHAELDKAQALDEGNPAELGQACARLKAKWPQLTILGGCCGTDDRHVEEIAKAVLGIPAQETQTA